MNKNRLEAFSDGVIAIIITIMVLELKVPHGPEWADIFKISHIFIGYVLSFMFVAIYWNNHHHFFQIIKKVNGATLWANMHLLFWLSLIPFSTAWMSETQFAAKPVTLYGFNLLMCAIAYTILSVIVVKLHGADSEPAQVLGKDIKGKISLVIYLTALIFSFFIPYLSVFLYFIVSIIWFVPDNRVEKKILSANSKMP